jgi:four helix bundle protein
LTSSGKKKSVLVDQSMDREEFQSRTKQFALRVIRLAGALPTSRSAEVIARQMIRSATSVGANYRAACRAKSSADMINKLKIVEEEADETSYWLELVVESELMTAERVSDLMVESNEIVAMTVASIKTLRKRQS